MAKDKQPKIEKAAIANPNKKAESFSCFLRYPPRKLRLVLDTIRFKPIYKAFGILSAIRKKGARLTEKVLTSAVANARVLGMTEDRLYVSAAFADGGPVFKRFRSRSMGRADRVLKKTSHLTIAVKEGLKSYTKPGMKHLEAAQQTADVKNKKKTNKVVAGKA